MEVELEVNYGENNVVTFVNFFHSFFFLLNLPYTWLVSFLLGRVLKRLYHRKFSGQVELEEIGYILGVSKPTNEDQTYDEKWAEK